MRRIVVGSLAIAASLFGFAHGAASAADCTKANCTDSAWVTACSATAACAQLDALKTTPFTTKRSYTPSNGVPDPNTERDVRRLGPKLKMRKNAVVAPNKVVTPYTPAPPKAGWASGPGAPPIKEVDRRGIAITGTTGTELGKSYGLALSTFKVLAGIEDATSGDPTRAKEDAAIAPQRSGWVGDPRRENYRVKTTHWPVYSCDEYGYKKQFEYMWFSESAIALGSDYRAIYDLAMRSDSVVKMRDRVLHTYGPKDATFMLREDYDHHDLPIQSTNLMQLYATGNLDGYATPWKPNPSASPWENQSLMEATRRSITDEEFAEIERRQRRFSELLSQLWAADFNIAEEQCKQKGFPGVQGKGFTFECLGKPGVKGPGTSKGTPGNVPTTGGGAGGPLPPLKHKAPPRLLEDAVAQNAPRKTVATKTPSSALRTDMAVSTMKQVQGLVKLNKVQGVNPPAQNGAGTTGGATGGATPPPSSGPDACAKAAYAVRKICYMQAAAAVIQSDIDKMIAFENSLPDKGCLNADPLKNRCDWSYKQFAEQIAYRRPDKDDADVCRQRIPDWTWLTDRTKQDKLIAKRMLYATDGGSTNPPIDYTSDITRVDAFLKALDDAPGKWAEYEKQRTQYLKLVATFTDQVKAIPGVGDTALGESRGDGFDIGNPDTFGAGAHYALSWGVTAVQMGAPTYSAEPGSACAPGTKCCNGIACGIEERVCRFNGAMSASADAKAFVFGSPEVLLDAAFTAYAEDDAKHAGNGAHMDAHFTFLNSELFPPDVKAGINTSSTGDFTIARPLADTSGQIPDPPIQVAFMVGPIPVTLEAGSVVSAGVDLSTSGTIGDTCSQKNVTPPFSLIASIAPRAKADAFGQAGVDLIAVSAGVRVDLNLLTLGLPLDVGFKTQGSDVVFDTRADLVATALAGGISLFAEVRYVLSSDTYELPIFSWGGVQGGKNLFDYNKTFPLDALSYRFFPPQVWRKL